VLVRADQRALQKIPGIGRKTAEQVLLSLRDKAEKMFSVIDEAKDGALPVAGAGAASGPDAQREEASAMLVSLGWRQKQVESALAKVLESEAWTSLVGGTLDELVRRGLAQLMAR
jgi:Holliday junction DNA helicase RuvA